MIQRRRKHAKVSQQDSTVELEGAVQLELPLGCQSYEQHAENHECIYRAIATNLSDFSDSEIVHWYNARAEHSENRIKELKLDFAAQHLPCRDFDASALYFAIVALAYNVFVLLRHVLPVEYESARITTVRLRLFDVAGKIVRHARQVVVKLNEWHYQRLQNAFSSIAQLLP